MTEAARVFHEDIREKKSIKNSASKTNRTGKGPVKFPSDYLSKKEKEALNGECSTWNLNGFYTWDEFKRMPDDIKISWLNRMLNVYGVRLCDITTIVFKKKNPAHLANYLSAHKEIHMYVNTPNRGMQIKPSELKRFSDAVDEWYAPKPIELEPETKSDDFTEEEKRFITTYIAPISEPKKVEDTMINPDDTDDSNISPTYVTYASDISPTHVTYAFDPAVLPKMSSIEFSMDGFDMDFLRMIRDRFGDQKVHVCVSVYVEKDMYGDSHE